MKGKKIKFQHPALEYCAENGEKDYIYVNGKYEVCTTCHGHGVTDRTDIDTSRLIDSMEEDGDYEGIDSYYDGAYDQICIECKGNKVVYRANDSEIPEWAEKAIYDWEESEREDAEIRRQEMAMGA